MDVQKVDLTTINNGAARELFQEEFNKVLGNINDISVDAKGAREIKLVFKIAPTEDRLSAAITIEVSSKLLSIQKHNGSMFLSHRKNGLEAYVTNPHQEQMNFDQPIDTP